MKRKVVRSPSRSPRKCFQSYEAGRPSRVLQLALLVGSTAALSAAPAAVPLVQGLTLVRAASERQGDYESTLTVDELDADGVLHLSTSADLPDPAGGKAQVGHFHSCRGR